ncbi:hypothetical protein [Nocardia sp. NPDC003963]
MDAATLRLLRAISDAARHQTGRRRDAISEIWDGVRILEDRDVLRSRLTPKGNDFVFRSTARPGARGAIPPSGRFPPYTPSRAELHVRSRQLTIDHEFSRGLPETGNGVYVTRDAGGAFYIYKPAAEEVFVEDNWLPYIPASWPSEKWQVIASSNF